MVSVIIPTYNRQSTILKSVRSVLEQSYQDLELIVVDDGSTDNTRNILLDIRDKRFKYIYQENKGACAARNKGISVARGEYIAFQDSDDIWKCEKLEIQLSKMKNNDANISFCAFNRMNYKKKIQQFPIMNEGYKSHKEILCGFYVSTQTIVAKKEIFEKNLFDITMERMQDYDLITRIAEKEKIYFIEDALVDLYLQSDSITVHKNIPSINLNILRKLLDKYSITAEKYPEWKLIMLKRIARAEVMLDIPSKDTHIEIWKLGKKPKDAIKLCLYQLGCMKKVYTIWDVIYGFFSRKIQVLGKIFKEK